MSELSGYVAKGSPRPAGGGEAPARGGRSGAARHIVRAIGGIVLASLCSVSHADERLKAQTFEVLNACANGIDDLNNLFSQLGANGWVRVPSESDITDHFAALEAEGIDIGNLSSHTYDESRFNGIVLYQHRIMLLISERGESVGFIPSTPFDNELLCRVTTTFPLTRQELSVGFGGRFDAIQEEEPGMLVLSNPPHFLSVAQMPDGTPKPVSGAMTQIMLSTKL